MPSIQGLVLIGVRKLVNSVIRVLTSGSEPEEHPRHFLLDAAGWLGVVKSEVNCFVASW